MPGTQIDHRLPFHSFGERGITFFIGTALAIVTVICVQWTYRVLTPRITSATYTIDGGATHSFVPPLSLPSGGSIVHISLFVAVPSFRVPSTYDIFADDCLEAVTVDDQPIAQPFVPFCDNTYPHRVPIMLSAGPHVINFTVKDNGGAFAFDFAPSRTDALSLGWWLAMAVVLIAYVRTLFGIFRFSSDTFLEWSSVALAVFVRVVYCLSTPFFVRAHEWDKHLDYIRSIATTLTVPVTGGWEFYRPPLYYVSSAVWWRFAEMFERPMYAIVSDIQFLSLFFSVLIVACIVVIARLLATSEKERALFILLTSLLPGTVFSASRITNDILFSLLAFALIAALFWWWRKPSIRLWYGAIILFGIAMATKASAIIFLPLFFLGFCCRDRRLFSSVRHWLLTATLIVVMTFAIPLIRIAYDSTQDPIIRLSGHGISPASAVDTDVDTMLSFRPSKILLSPYNDPTGDNPEKHFFLEFLYRSAFFGEFSFSHSFRTVNFLQLLFGLILLLFAIAGLLRSFLRPTTWSAPMFLLGVSSIMALAFFRIVFPFSCSQDFRFIPFVIVPLAHYILSGISAMPIILRRIGYSCVVAMIICEVIFFLKLAYYVGG